MPRIRRAAAELLEAGATLVAGHSAHVFHGVERGALYDLGDFVDDYATHPVLRNDLGLLFLVTLEQSGPVRLEALPLKLELLLHATSRRRRRGPDPPSLPRCLCAAGVGGAGGGRRLFVDWVPVRASVC